MKNLIKILFAITLFGLAACSDDPNSVGSGLIPDEDKLTFETLDSYKDGFNQSFESFKYDSLIFGSSSTALLGSYKNIQSEVLIGFLINPPDSILNPFKADSINLIKCWVQIEPTYWIGDSNNFNFSIQRINTSWNPSTYTIDTLNEINANLGPNLFDASTYSYVDTLIKFDLDKELVKGWIRRTYDTSVEKDYGIMMKPISSTGIFGFQALTAYPIYSYPALYMVFEKPGEFTDTLVATPSVDLHVPSGNLDPDGSQSVLLQTLLSKRAKLKFDLSMLPENIIVNKATLSLYIDDMNTEFGSIEADTIALNFLEEYDNVIISDKIGRYPIPKKDNSYTGDIRFYVQMWVDGEPNNGVQLNLTDELRAVSKVGIYNTNAVVDSLKPRLTIYYTKK
ncbi:MAG: DNRLRE domain-containing protein [Ignavibacteriales bacterium]|nr:DNRLRE domain-containing protein [Ignavibacteriales bacterium]